MPYMPTNHSDVPIRLFKSDFLEAFTHIHPGVVLSGQARQRLRLPCFWFGERLAIIPAFGLSTGLHVIRPERTDRVYACTERAVLDVNGAFAGRATSPRTK